MPFDGIPNGGIGRETRNIKVAVGYALEQVSTYAAAASAARQENTSLPTLPLE